MKMTKKEYIELEMRKRELDHMAEILMAELGLNTNNPDVDDFYKKYVPGKGWIKVPRRLHLP